MKQRRANSTREAWVLCLILGIIMLNFPFLHIFNTGKYLFGIPILVIYFFVGWPLSIGVVFLFVHQLQKGQNNSENDDGERDSL